MESTNRKRLLSIRGVRKAFGDQTVLRDVNLEVDKGDVVAILGPSGSGKTTLLRCLNFLEHADGGELTFDGESFDLAHIARRDIARIRRKTAFVFQSYNLFLNKTALGNIMEGLVVARKISKAEARETGMRMLAKVGLADRSNAYPAELSGGQQQRVAIARSLVNQPRVLLLDEPLGALDLKLRKEMQLELKRLQREMNITFVYVTHDQEEALTMSDTVVVMNKGNIQQIGSPQDIYNEPRNAFVAKFIGDSNIVDGIMEKDFLVSFGGQEFACVDRGFKPREPVQVVIRPEDVDIVPPSAGKLTGLVREVIFKGVHFEMHVDVEGKEWLIHSTQASQPGELIGMNIGPDEIHIMSREEV